MWSSIKQIIKPDSLSEASVLLKDTSSALFAGGTYLVGEKNSRIHTLLDINHLIDDNIETQDKEIHIDAGCTLQEVVRFDNPPLNTAILAACPSKNIRNQRTIGGEIARGRTDSDLLIFLFTARAKLILSQSETPMELSNWNGEGIITKVIVPQHAVKQERVALLDSAPAYVIVGINELNEMISVAVGGKTSRIAYFQTRPEPDESETRKFMVEIEGIFTDDHHGSSAYKRHLVCSLLQEMAVVR